MSTKTEGPKQNNRHWLSLPMLEGGEPYFDVDTIDLYRKPKIKQHKTQVKTGVNSCARKGKLFLLHNNSSNTTVTRNKCSNNAHSKQKQDKSVISGTNSC